MSATNLERQSGQGSHDMSEEETRIVIRRHMEAWRRGDVPALLADYADDAVMMSAAVGALVGKPAIAAMYEQVFETLFRPEDTKLEVSSEIVSGEYALVHWTATTSSMRTQGGFDCYALRDGKIAAQSAGMEMIPLD